MTTVVSGINAEQQHYLFLKPKLDLDPKVVAVQGKWCECFTNVSHLSIPTAKVVELGSVCFLRKLLHVEKLVTYQTSCQWWTTFSTT